MSLTNQQEQFIATYMTSKNITEACDKLNIARSTAYKYLENKEIQQEINKIKRQFVTDTALYLQSSLKECSKKLLEIINDAKTPPQTKINAINCVFNNCLKITETADILTKVEELEAKLLEAESEAKND